MNGNIELYRTSPGPYKGRAQQWRFRWRAGNGRVIAVGSESYTNRKDAIAAIRLVFGERAEFLEPDAVTL
jgi:uncharacterized protein YegP (UPF0339 family)